MNNDLISRSALKEHAETVTLWNGDIRRFVSYETIDNAPTVDRPQGELAERALEIIDRLRTDGHINNKEQGTLRRAILLLERPQGEWIIDGHHYKCSRCGKTLAIMFSETDDDDLIGCPFCLADMRGDDT